MIEVEKKCKLTENKAKELIQTLHKKTKFIGKIRKEDQYYIQKEHSKNQINFNNPVFRIRQINDNYKLTFKKKILKDNAEINNEEEFIINDIKVFKLFIEYMGFVKFVDKIKDITLFNYNNIHIELAYIQKLGYFIEIEGLCKNKKEVDTIIKTIDHILFEELKLSKNSVEKKMYIELLCGEPL